MIEKRLIKCIGNVLRIKEEFIAIDAHLQKDLGADSLDILTIRLNIEDEFKFRFADSELTELLNVNKILKVIEQRTKR